MNTKHPAMTALAQLQSHPGMSESTLDAVVGWATDYGDMKNVAPRLQWAIKALHQGQTLPHDAADLEDAYGFDVAQAEIAPFVEALAAPMTQEGEAA
jgi:hypothetical protein